MRKPTLAVFVVACLAGCATVGELQSQCDRPQTTFAELVACTKTAINAESRLNDDARIRLYVLLGEKLAKDVVDGKTSDLDARIAWQKSYLEFKGQDDRSRANLAAALLMSQSLQQRTQPSPIDAYKSVQPESPTTTTTNCLTQGMGAFGTKIDCTSNTR